MKGIPATPGLSGLRVKSWEMGSDFFVPRSPTHLGGTPRRSADGVHSHQPLALGSGASFKGECIYSHAKNPVNKDTSTVFFLALPQYKRQTLEIRQQPAPPPKAPASGPPGEGSNHHAGHQRDRRTLLSRLAECAANTETSHKDALQAGLSAMAGRTERHQGMSQSTPSVGSSRALNRCKETPTELRITEAKVSQRAYDINHSSPMPRQRHRHGGRRTRSIHRSRAQCSAPEIKVVSQLGEQAC